PTTDKNKESIFNYINNKISFDGIKVCDIYAGSGSLGLEALSRGANEVHFVENNYSVYKNLLNNIESLKISEKTKVFRMSALKFSNLSKHDKYDLIIADPPFFRYDIYSVAENLIRNQYLEKDGIFLIERSIQTEEKDSSNFNNGPIKKLGDSLIYEFIFT
ncbi:MAG: 16S rRNA (guanine(966)-N(2))-methyltransferase RsmD, partial [Melioribacteraceae bacterium]|nr:16S rRNA (guanine(966)-N(2))-methyltransferase RsmD [Melioribacteraceae bacterium]